MDTYPAFVKALIVCGYWVGTEPAVPQHVMVPWGKYAGRSIRKMLPDASHIEWLNMNMGTFYKLYPQVYEALFEIGRLKRPE